MEKIIIASDIHGSAYWCKELLSVFENEQADRLVLLAGEEAKKLSNLYTREGGTQE